MGNESKSQRRRLRRQRQAKRLRAKLNSKAGLAQVHPQQNFYDLLGSAQQKALQPYIAEQVKQLGQAVARNLIETMGKYALRLAVLENLSKEKLSETEASLNERYMIEEDGILGLTTSTEAAQAGDYCRITVQDIGNKGTKPQMLIAEHIATDTNGRYEVNEAVEKEVVGMLKGQNKLITTKMPDGKDYTFSVTLERVSKHPAPAAELNPVATETSSGE